MIDEEEEFWWSNAWFNIKIPKYGHKVHYIDKSKEKLEKFLAGRSPGKFIKKFPVTISRDDRAFTALSAHLFNIKWKIKDFNLKLKLKNYYYEKIFIITRIKIIKFKIKRIFKKIPEKIDHWRFSRIKLPVFKSNLNETSCKKLKIIRKEVKFQMDQRSLFEDHLS